MDKIVVTKDQRHCTACGSIGEYHLKAVLAKGVELCLPCLHDGARAIKEHPRPSDELLNALCTLIRDAEGDGPTLPEALRRIIAERDALRVKWGKALAEVSILAELRRVLYWEKDAAPGEDDVARLRSIIRLKDDAMAAAHRAQGLADIVNDTPSRLPGSPRLVDNLKDIIAERDELRSVNLPEVRKLLWFNTDGPVTIIDCVRALIAERDELRTRLQQVRDGSWPSTSGTTRILVDEEAIVAAKNALQNAMREVRDVVMENAHLLK